MTTLGEDDRSTQSLYKKGLLAQGVKVRLFQLHRMRNPRSLAVMRSIGQSMRADKIDVAHILMGGGEVWTAVLATLVRDLPLVSTMIIPEPNVGEYPPAFVVYAANWLLARASQIVVVNCRNQISLVSRKYRLPPDRIVHVYLSPRIVSSRWSGAANSEEPGTILFFGRVVPHKGLEYLIRAQPLISQQVPNARIVIAGHGVHLDRCRLLIEDNDSFEIYDGYVPGEVASQLFRRAALVVLPYISASTSGVLMNAYVCGKPVVATTAGCLPEYVEDGATGLLVPPADVEELASAIVRLLSNDILRQSMGETAASRVKGKYSWQNVAMQTAKAYEKALSMHPRS